MSIALVGGKIVTPFRIIENSVLTTKEDKIFEIGYADDLNISDNSEVIDIKDHYLVPGFVDLLVHGGGGFGFSDGIYESIPKISEYFLKHGSTSMLGSLHAKPERDLLDDLSKLSDFILANPNSNIKAIHMEGPYLNPLLKGAMNEDYLWKPSIESFNKMWEASKGLIKIMTIAPELPGALDVIREASFRGVVCSIGHSTADYETIDKAISNGAAHVTHIFNAMKQMHHREPSLITASLLRDELKIELIADKLHVHPAVMELLLKTKTSKGIILITDSIRAGGMHDGEFQFSDQKVILNNNKATLVDGTLAGSTLTLDNAIKNLLDTTSASITDAVRMSSLNGAKVIGLDRGIIASGKTADLVVLDKNWKVQFTILNGKIAYRRNKI